MVFEMVYHKSPFTWYLSLMVYFVLVSWTVRNGKLERERPKVISWLERRSSQLWNALHCDFHLRMCKYCMQYTATSENNPSIAREI